MIAAIEQVAGVSLITPDRLENLVRAVERTRGVQGDMAELGVYKGGSASVIATVRPEVTLHLFDTFAGLPRSEAPNFDTKGLLKEGEFACDVQTVKAYLKGCDCRYYVGRFPSMWSEMRTFFMQLPLSFVHIDCDLGDTAQSGIELFWPMMSPGGIMYFDDYGCEFTGVTRAVDAAFTPEQIEKQYDVNGFQIGALVCKPSA